MSGLKRMLLVISLCMLVMASNTAILVAGETLAGLEHIRADAKTVVRLYENENIGKALEVITSLKVDCYMLVKNAENEELNAEAIGYLTSIAAACRMQEGNEDILGSVVEEFKRAEEKYSRKVSIENDRSNISCAWGWLAVLGVIAFAGYHLFQMIREY